MPLQLIYDAVNGLPIRDGEVDLYVDTIIRTHADSVITLDIASELLVTAIRVAIREGRLAPDHLQMLYRAYRADAGGLLREQPLQEIHFDRHGRSGFWPAGFCDHSENYLMRLLDWDDGSPESV